MRACRSVPLATCKHIYGHFLPTLHIVIFICCTDLCRAVSHWFCLFQYSGLVHGADSAALTGIALQGAEYILNSLHGSPVVMDILAALSDLLKL